MLMLLVWGPQVGNEGSGANSKALCCISCNHPSGLTKSSLIKRWEPFPTGSSSRAFYRRPFWQEVYPPSSLSRRRQEPNLGASLSGWPYLALAGIPGA